MYPMHLLNRMSKAGYTSIERAPKYRITMFEKKKKKRYLVSKQGGRSLEKKNHARLSWHKRSHFWQKPVCDLSLATMLVLEQVSVFNNLKRTKECRNKCLLPGRRSNNCKDDVSILRTPVLLQR